MNRPAGRSGRSAATRSRTLIVEASRISAWLFDLDGVTTDTASLHDQAWKTVLDRFLSSLEPPQPPFDPIRDYQRFVDGKPHADGLRDFLASRGVTVPEGTALDAQGSATITGLAKTKDAMYLGQLASHGVTVFPDAIELMDAIAIAGARVAVVTASEHCSEVLAAGGLSGRFDAQVDGIVTKTGALRGKPAPDTYLLAASLLDTPPHQAAVIEDAPAGVAAGRAGKFGLVVGVARRTPSKALFEAGAGIVVRRLSALLAASKGADGVHR